MTKADTHRPRRWLPAGLRRSELVAWMTPPIKRLLPPLEPSHPTYSQCPLMNQSGHQMTGRRWEEGFSALRTFKRQHGHCLVPRWHMQGKYKLGQWVAVQRYRKANLSSERKRRLDDIGFVWSWRDLLWEKNFAALKAFK